MTFIYRSLRFIIFLIFTLLFLSCDDFLLKKTVNVQYLEGEINYDPSTASISGRLAYDIQNNQTVTLHEIYFISHNLVSLDYVTYNGDVMRFEQGLGYGSGIYRIRIPQLKSGEKARVELKFRLEGPVEEDRFLLTKDNVFIDAEKIWLPVPFAQKPEFLYSIKIKTPEDYYAVIGARIKEETVKNGKRVSSWESETPNVLLTGNIFISKFNRQKEGNIYLYSVTTNYSDVIFKYSAKVLDTLSNFLGPYALSQLHIVNEMFQYNDMEEFIDGEAMANIIEISPDLTANDLLNENTVSSSLSPDIPRKSVWKIFETLAHEMSHTYIRGILKFDDDSYLESESMTEFMGLDIISQDDKNIYNKFIQRNRIELINLDLAKDSHIDQIKYIYGINCLSAAFYSSEELFFTFLKTLIEKYKYTDIKVDELILTAQEMNDAALKKINSESTNSNENIIDYEALKLWSKYELYNLALSNTIIQITNIQIINIHKKKTIIEDKILCFLNNDFPINIDVTMYENFSSNTVTNIISMTKNSETNFIFDKDLKSVEITSHYDMLEKNLSDNRIDFEKNNSNEIIEDINNFYNGQKTGKAVIFDKSAANQQGWRNLYDDREASLLIKTNISFRFDKVRENDDEIYLQAYKMLDGKPFSYVVFKGRKLKDKCNMIAVIDPVL